METIDISTGHGGNIHLISREKNVENLNLIDFSANINPLGPPKWLRQTLSREFENIVHYPDPDSFKLVGAIAEHYSIQRELIVPANGTTELLYLLPRVIKCKRAIIAVPSYIDYIKVMELNNIEVVQILLRAEDEFHLDIKKLREIIRDDDLVVIGS